MYLQSRDSFSADHASHACAISMYHMHCHVLTENHIFLEYISTPLNFPGCTHVDTGHYIIYANGRNQLVVLSFDITH